MNHEDPTSSEFGDWGSDPTIAVKLNLAKKMAEDKRAREAAAKGENELSTKDDIVARLTERVNGNAANAIDALAPGGKVKGIGEIFKQQAISERDERLYGGGHVDDQKSDVIEAIKEGLRESVTVEKVKMHPLDTLTAESNKLFKEMVVRYIRDLREKNGGEIPPEEIVRSSIKRTFHEDERKQFDAIYKEMAMGAVFDDVPDMPAETVSTVPATPVEGIEQAPVPDEWDAVFNAPVDADHGLDENIPPPPPPPNDENVPPPPDEEKPESSWTPVRKGVVGRAAGSEDKDAIKNSETGQWEFSEKIIEEKRREMEKDLAEKNKEEFAALFAEEAAKLGTEEFDDSYLLAMIVDRRGGKPLDSAEIVMYRNLFAERYPTVAEIGTKKVSVPTEETMHDTIVVEGSEKTSESIVPAVPVAENVPLEEEIDVGAGTAGSALSKEETAGDKVEVGESVQMPEVVAVPEPVVESVPTKEEQEAIDNELRMLFSGDDPELSDHVSVLSMTEEQVDMVDAMLDAQDEEELNPLSAAEAAGPVDFSGANSWEELVALINSVEKIEGSSETFDREKLLDRLEKVHARKISVVGVTRTGGLRAKVMELMKKEAGSIEDFYATAPAARSAEAAAHETPVAAPPASVAETAMSVTPEVNEERKKLNSILKLLQPEADPLDPRNDREVMVMVHLAFSEGMLGEEMSEGLKNACAKATENIGVPGGGIGTIKAKWVEEAHSLGAAIHARGGEHSASATSSAEPTSSVDAAPAATSPAEAEVVPPLAPPVTETPFSLTPEMAAESKRKVEEFYAELSFAERERISTGMSNWGWSLKKFTGEMLASAVPVEMRNNNQLLDVWARRREKDAYAAELQLRAAKEDKQDEDGSLGIRIKVSKFRKAKRFLGSAGVIGGMSARIGRPVASFFGVMPLGGIMLSSLAIAETAGIVKDYNEQTVANSLRGNEDYRKRDDESKEEYIARTSGGGAMDEAWELYNQAKNGDPDAKPTKEQIDAAYFKNLPAELMDRLDKTTPSARDWWFQRKMQQHVRQKIVDMNHVISGGSTEDEREKMRSNKKYRRLMDRYARLIEDTGTVHSFALAAIQAEKINKGIVTALSVDAWGRGAVGIYRMASNFFDGDAKIKISGLSQILPRGSQASATGLTAEQLAAQEQIAKSRMTYDAVKSWLASQKDKNAALASMRQELATTGGDPAHMEALKEVLKEEEAAAVTAKLEADKKAALKLESDRKAVEAIVARERQKALALEQSQKGGAVAKLPPSSVRIPEVKDSVLAETVIPTEIIRHVRDLPAERVVSQYLISFPDAARRLGWNGTEDIVNWASVRAHGMWIEYAETVLTPVKRLELQRMNFTGDAQGLAEFLRRDRGNAIRFDLKNGKIDVVGDAFFKHDTALHGGQHPTALKEAEERLAEQARARGKAGTTPLRETSGLPRMRQTIDQIVYSGNVDSAIRAREMSAAIRSGSVSPNVFATYFAQQMKMPENSQSVVSLLKALEDLRGTPAEQQNAELVLKISMQNMIMTHPEGPTGGVQLGERAPMSGVPSESAHTGDFIKTAEMMNPIVHGTGDSMSRVDKILSLQRQGKIDAVAFANYYAQQLDAYGGTPQFDAEGKKKFVLASESSILEIRRIFASATQYPETIQSRAAKQQLASMIGGMTRRK